MFAIGAGNTMLRKKHFALIGNLYSKKCPINLCGRGEPVGNCGLLIAQQRVSTPRAPFLCNSASNGKPEKVQPMISTSKAYLAIGVLFSFAAVVAVEEVRLAAAYEEIAERKTELADFKLNVETLQRDALEKAAKETQRRLTQQRKIIDAKEQTIKKLRADFNSANAVSKRLHDRIQELTRANTNQSTGNPTPTGNSKTESTTERIGDLARMVDETAGTLARELDDAIARGKACEVMYKSLTE